MADLAKLLSAPASRHDKELLWMLVILLVEDLASAVLLTLVRAPGGIGYFYAGIYGAGLLFALIAGLGFVRGHYSLAGFFSLLLIVLVFHTWNTALAWAGLLSGWWHEGQPAYHLVVAAAVGLIPLLLGTWQFERRLRRVPLD
jgi:hypothetical protein